MLNSASRGKNARTKISHTDCSRNRSALTCSMFSAAVQFNGNKHKKLGYRRETARQLRNVYQGWLTDSAMHRTPRNSLVLFFDIQSFKRSDSRSAGRKRILTCIIFYATQGHSFCNQLPADKSQGAAYRHIILLAVSLKFSKT